MVAWRHISLKTLRNPWFPVAAKSDMPSSHVQMKPSLSDDDVEKIFAPNESPTRILKIKLTNGQTGSQEPTTAENNSSINKVVCWSCLVRANCQWLRLCLMSKVALSGPGYWSFQTISNSLSTSQLQHQNLLSLYFSLPFPVVIETVIESPPRSFGFHR